MRVRRKTRKRPQVGLQEWFRIGESERVEQVLEDLRALNVSDLRTGLSWSEWLTPEGHDWYQWLLPRLAHEVRVLPCLLHAPPSLGLVPFSPPSKGGDTEGVRSFSPPSKGGDTDGVPDLSSPPRRPQDFADFAEEVVTQVGGCFQWLELWNEPNNPRGWDLVLDPQWKLFAEMIAAAAPVAQRRGKRVVLGGMWPIDVNWLRLMAQHGALKHIDAVGVHGFPPSSEPQGELWRATINSLRDVLKSSAAGVQVWITQAGYSTWRHDERAQLLSFIEAIEAPVERVYWHSVHDLDPARREQDDQADEREYHYGLKHHDGRPKLLFRLWQQGGLPNVEDALWLARPANRVRQQRHTLITGGAGFIGTNLAHRLASCGRPVLLYDNLSRPGVEQNLAWLREVHGNLVQVEVADVRNARSLASAVNNAAQVFHFAAQVAATSSLLDPVFDFEVNGRGTLNLLEALRAASNPPPLLFTSTSKVYGNLHDLKLATNGARYVPDDPEIRAHGISEARSLDLCSPFGCSKGAADQYVLDFARTFSLPATVFRMSCIYGPHQFGTEDQGWVAHFLSRAIEGKPITVYGDGKQVRDILFVDDLLDAFLTAQERISSLAGNGFNIGGGAAHTTSLLELIAMITAVHREAPKLQFEDWRATDQRYYVSDARKFHKATGWLPKVGVAEGVGKLYQWLQRARYSMPTALPERRARVLPNVVSFTPLLPKEQVS